MRQFIVKMSGIVMLIACVLLMEGLIQGNLGWLAGVALLPAFGWLTLRLLRAGAKAEKPKARRATAHGGGGRRRAVPAPRPALRVVQGRGRPDGPWAA